MKRIILDTNAYAGFKKGHSDIIAIIQHADKIGMSAVVLGELLAGFAAGTKYHENLTELNHFLNNSRVAILAIDDTTASFYAQIYAGLRRAGKPIPTNDLWIAASVLQHGYKLCSFDKHFSSIQNLIIVTNLDEFIL